MPSANSAGGGTLTTGASTHGASPMGSSVRSAGTCNASTWTWWLPVPQSPATVHVSSMTTWPGANTAMRIRGPSPSIPSTQLP